MKLFNSFLISFLFLLNLSQASAATNSFGVNAAVGAPYLTQFGLNYQMHDMLGFSINYGLLDTKIDDVSIKLSMPEAMVHYYPFAGAFFVGAGIGQQSFTISGVEKTTSATITADATATTMIAKIGCMWGVESTGFWYGIDLSYVSPMNADTAIKTSLPVSTSTKEYKDVAEAVDKYAKSAYPSLALIRLGWLF